MISGFSGAGKGTVVKQLRALNPAYWVSISMTTRQKRPGEQEGVDYYFVSREEFEKEIAQNGLLEFTAYVNNYYGTPRKYVESMLCEGRDVILEIESNGGAQVKEIFPGAILIFLTAPDAETLAQRLRGRGTESDEVIEGRLRRAREESRIIGRYDYLLVNEEGKAAECAEKIDKIVRISRAETERQRELIESLQTGFDRLLAQHREASGSPA